jgi:hypothetical protein
MPTNLNIRIPDIRSVSKIEMSRDNQKEVAASLAPTLQHLVSAAGFKLSDVDVAELHNAFIERGTISIAPGGPNMSATVSVEANSLNYTSKSMRQINE